MIQFKKKIVLLLVTIYCLNLDFLKYIFVENINN